MLINARAPPLEGAVTDGEEPREREAGPIVSPPARGNWIVTHWTNGEAADSCPRPTPRTRPGPLTEQVSGELQRGAARPQIHPVEFAQPCSRRRRLGAGCRLTWRAGSSPTSVDAPPLMTPEVWPRSDVAAESRRVTAVAVRSRRR